MLWHGSWRESLFFNLCTGTKHGCLQAKHVNHVFKTSFSDGTGYCKDITRPASPEHEDIQTKTLQLNSKLPFLWNFRGFSPFSELQHYNLSVGEGGSRLFRSFRRCTRNKSDRSLGHKQIEYKSELSLPWSYLKLQQEIPRGSMGFQSAFFDWARLRECVWDINPDICQFKVCKAKVWALLFHAVPLSVLLQFPMNSPNDLRRQKTPPSRRAKRRRRFVRPDLGFYLQNCPKSQEGVEEGVASRYFTGTGD